jgi:hypothetical protein
VGRDGAEDAGDLGYSKSGIFFRAGLDGPNQIESAGEIRFLAQSIRVIYAFRTEATRMDS